MKRITRRSFIQRGSLAAGAAVTVSSWSRVLGANGDVRVGVVGFRGQGNRGDPDPVRRGADEAT